MNIRIRSNEGLEVHRNGKKVYVCHAEYFEPGQKFICEDDDIWMLTCYCDHWMLYCLRNGFAWNSGVRCETMTFEKFEQAFECSSVFKYKCERFEVTGNFRVFVDDRLVYESDVPQPGQVYRNKGMGDEYMLAMVGATAGLVNLSNGCFYGDEMIPVGNAENMSDEEIKAIFVSMRLWELVEPC